MNNDMESKIEEELNKRVKKSEVVKIIKRWFEIIEINPDILIDGIITMTAEGD